MIKSIYHDTVVSFQCAKNADNESLTGAGVDMQGKKGVVFIVAALQGEAADFTIKAQQDSDSAYGTAADLEGTSVAFSTGSSADAVAVLEIVDPLERYVRPVIAVPDLSAAKAVACIAIAYGGQYKPETAPTYGEHHVAPAEGTA